MKYHIIVILQSKFESRSKQDSCVGIVITDSFDIWTVKDLTVKDLKYHHNVILQSNFESKSEQDSSVWIVTRGTISHLDNRRT